MKKILTALVGICAIVFASNIVNAQDLNSAIQDAIISNQKLGSCSAGVVNDGLTIIGLMTPFSLILFARVSRFSLLYALNG